MILQTERLIMRRWLDRDREPFAALNADPEVMEHFPATLTREQSDALVNRIEQKGFETLGYGLWALEVRETGEFIGFAGLALQTFDAPFLPAIEVGWRLARHTWGNGYATEAGRAALTHGFEKLDLPEIISMTAHQNTRSRAVMERLGMTYSPADDFRHPALPTDHPLSPHVLYRLSSPAGT